MEQEEMRSLRGKKRQIQNGQNVGIPRGYNIVVSMLYGSNELWLEIECNLIVGSAKNVFSTWDRATAGTSLSPM
eukprot:scaffold475_cov92-Skeletonema_marinoi.AAC.1